MILDVTVRQHVYFSLLSRDHTAVCLHISLKTSSATFAFASAIS